MIDMYKITSISIKNEDISIVNLVRLGERDNGGVFGVTPEVVESNIRNNVWKVYDVNMQSIESASDIDVKEMMLRGKARRKYEDNKGNTVKDHYKESDDGIVIKIENRNIKTESDVIDFDEINKLYRGCKIDCRVTTICCNSKRVTIKGESLSDNICIDEPEHIENIDISWLTGMSCLVDITTSVDKLNIGSLNSIKRGIRKIKIDNGIQEMSVKLGRHYKFMKIEYKGEKVGIGRIVVKGEADDIISTLINIGIVEEWYTISGLNEHRIAYIEDETEIDIRELELYMRIKDSHLKAIGADSIEGNLVVVAKEEQIADGGITMEEKNKLFERARKLGIKINGYTIIKE